MLVWGNGCGTFNRALVMYSKVVKKIDVGVCNKETSQKATAFV
jgi:hypothetical protein